MLWAVRQGRGDPAAALRLIEDTEKAIMKRLNNPLSFKPYRSAKDRASVGKTAVNAANWLLSESGRTAGFSIVSQASLPLPTIVVMLFLLFGLLTLGGSHRGFAALIVVEGLFELVEGVVDLFLVPFGVGLDFGQGSVVGVDGFEYLLAVDHHVVLCKRRARP